MKFYKALDSVKLKKYSEVDKKQFALSFFSKSIKLYPETNGYVSGILGRYSGELVLNFKREDSHKTNSLIFNCRKFAFKDRKF